MTADRIKEIQMATAYPNSQSVQQALLQVWNECIQESYTKEEVLAFVKCIPTNLNITLEDYDSTCADGCCYDYGTITTVNGVELECHNTDTETIVRQILEHLGYKVTIEHK